ncbi:hypothetical protein [Streptomyces virginiae]
MIGEHWYGAASARGALVQNIVTTVAITAIEAQGSPLPAPASTPTA